MRTIIFVLCLSISALGTRSGAMEGDHPNPGGNTNQGDLAKYKQALAEKAHAQAARAAAEAAQKAALARQQEANKARIQNQENHKQVFTGDTNKQRFNGGGDGWNKQKVAGGDGGGDAWNKQKAAGGDGGGEGWKNRKVAGEDSGGDGRAEGGGDGAKAANLEAGREGRASDRQARQAKRIAMGIEKGALTPDEVTKLQTQQTAIAKLRDGLLGDGSLSKTDMQQLREQLDIASRCIFAEKHDDEGVALPVYRLGKNVYLNPEIAKKLEEPNLDRTTAVAFATDFQKLLTLKRRLATEDLTAVQRQNLQDQYDALLSQYFVTTTPASANAPAAQAATAVAAAQ